MENTKTPHGETYPIEIPDSVWEKILPVLQDNPKVYVGEPQPCRKFLSAVLWMTKNGAPWRDLPKSYGYWNTIYRHFGRWCDAGVFEHKMAIFHTDEAVYARLVDSTMIRAHASAAGAPTQKGGQKAEALGRSRGGFSSKLNICYSDEGVALRFILTAGQCHDVTQGIHLIEGFSCPYVIGDKGYDSDAFIAAIEAMGAVAVIPPRKNRVEQRCYDEQLYKTRNLIERFIGYLKRYRRVFSRYDKLAVRYLGFVYFATVLIQCR
jgi:transposase